MRKLTQDQFLEYFNSQVKVVSLVDIEVDEHVIIRNLDRKDLEKLVINRCNFNGGLSIYMPERADLLIIFTKVDIQLEVNPLNESIDIGKIKFSTVELDSLDFKSVRCKGISLTNVQANYLSIENSTVIEEEIKIFDSEFKQDLHFKGVKSENVLNIDNIKLYGNFYAENCVFDGIQITNSIFYGEFYPASTAFKVWIHKSKFHNQVAFEDCKIDKITINDSEFQSSVIFEYSLNGFSNANTGVKIVAFEVYSTSFLGGLSFSKDDIVEIIIERLKIFCTSNTRGDVTIDEIKIDNLIIQGTNKDSSITFLGCNFNKSIIFFQFLNFGKLSFFGDQIFNKDLLFIIQDTILGSTHLIGIDLSKISAFNFYDSDISAISFSSVKWFEDIEFPHFHYSKEDLVKLGVSDKGNSLGKFMDAENADLETYHANRRELYRQLKSASERQNDRIHSLQFLRLEMKFYSKLLNNKNHSSSLSDRIILALEWTNEYGLNWVRPVLFAFGSTLLFTFLMMIFVNGEHITCQCNGLSGQISSFISEVAYVFPQMLNPVRSLEKIFPYAIEPTAAIIWLDYLHRLIIAFFIVQTVSAFRKFIKK